MAATDAGLSSLALSTYSNSTYYSTFFPATGSYLTGSNAIFNISATTSVWNFECWVYPVSGTGYFFGIGSGVAFSNSIAINYGFTTANKFTILQGNGSSNPVSLSTTNTYALGNWYHVAVSRTSAGVIRIFVNGVQDGTVTYNAAVVSTGTTFVVNGVNDNNGLGSGGGNFYLSNLRFIVGSTLYTSNFNPPSTQLTAVANTQLLICNANGANDSSSNNLAITKVGNYGFKQFTPALQVNASATLTPSFTTGTLSYTFNAPSNVTAFSVTPTLVDPALATMKYNGNVALTSGQSNIASAAPFFNNGYSETFTAGLLQYANSPAINTAGYSWTAEMWVNPTGVYTATNTLFAKRVSATTATAYEGYLNITTGAISFFNGTSYVSSYILPANTWSHVAYTYDGASINIYVNGTRVYSAVVTITDNAEPLTIGGARGYAEWMLGNISNFRFVKGYVIYTQTFTPPSQPLGLTQSSSTGVRAITGAPANGNSGYFNGTNAYLTAPSNAAFEFGTGNFTIEFWVYWNTTPGISQLYDARPTGTASTTNYAIIGTNASVLNYYTAGANPAITGPTVVAGQWYHVAVSRSGTSTSLFVNGTQRGSTITDAQSYVNGASRPIFGADGNAPTASLLNGYMSNIRVVKGTALYTSNFLVTSSPLTAITNTSLLALRSSLTTDASTNNFTLTNTNVTLSTAFSPFSGGSASNQFLSTSLAYQVVRNPYNPSLSLGQGHNNFTAECWAYLTALPPGAPGWYLMQKGVGTGPGVEWSFSITSTGMYFQAQSGIPYATTIVNNSSNTINMTVGQWNHFAITKVGTSVHFWFNGIYSGTINGVNNFYYSAAATSVVTIANSSTGGTTAFTGFISNARVVYGKAVYTADINTGFTPNTTQLTAIQNATATTASIDNASSYVVANGSSVYFNNSNDFLTFPEPTASTSDVTIEAWVLLSAAPTTRGWIINNNAASTGYFGIAIEAARTITIFSDNNATAVLTSAKLVPLNTWTHIAVVFSNGNIYTYINGWRDTNTVVKTTVWGAATPGTVYVGRQASAAAQYFPGYITNLHVVYNTSVYTTKFSVPTSPSTAIGNTVFLGLQSSVTLDSSSSNRTITRGTGSTGLLLSPMTSPFTTYIPSVTNSHSMAFGWGTSSTTDGVSVALTSVASTLLLGDFTIELWAYLEVLPTSAAVFVSSSLSTYAFSVSSTGLLAFSPAGLVGTTVIAPKTWYHFAVTRQQGTMKLWINGIVEATAFSISTFTGNGVSSLNIGFSDSPVSYFYGYMNNFRFIPGTCIYTGNFTPSAVPYSLTSSSSTNTLAVTSITTHPSVGNPTGISYSGSAYLENGSTTAPNNGRYELSTFDFTIEGWFNCNGVSGNHVIMNHGQNRESWILYVLKQTATTGYLYFVARVGKANSTTFISVSAGVITINSNQWYHTAAVRIGNVITLYLNGTAVATQTLSTSQYMLGVSTQVFTIGNETGATSYFYGYLSNLRVIRGYGIYTGAFTPPTTALTNTQASGTNIIALGNSMPALGNSVYFNGTSDYMKAPSTVSSFGTGDFTIETYYFPTSFAAVTTLFGQYTAATTALGYWNVQITTAGIITVYYNGSTNFVASTVILVNEWAHIALVRISGTIRLYVNGVLYGTQAYATQFGLTSVASPLHIGATQLSGPTQYALGYFSNLRIVKGVGVYTGVFTASTSPLSSTQSAGTNIAAITGVSTSLLLYQDSPFTDNSTFNNPITGFGNPQYSPVFSPSFFTYPTPTNGNSGYFTGTSSFLSLTQPSNAGTGNFTIELWVYPTVLAATNYLLSTSTNAANCFHLWITSTGEVSLAVDSATANIVSDQYMFAKVGAWTHIAITRNSGVVYMYFNGIRQLTTLTKATQFGDTDLLNIGRNQPSVNQFFTGYITNVRFVYGTPAVYTSNGSTSVDTPPYATPLTAITNTTLLLLQSTLTKDNSANNVTVTNTGVVLSTYTNPYTMMKMPVLLTAQVGTPGVNFRDSSMYSAIFAASTASTGYHPTVSPFGVAPLILLGQTLNNINADSSIGNYTLSLNTATIMPYVTPFSGQSITFNGSTQYITGTNLYNSLGGDFTIEFFMMAGPQTATTGALLLGKNESYTTGTNNYYIMCSNSGVFGQTIKIFNYTINTTAPIFSGSIPVCDSKWHHIAMVRISGIVTVYVDGVQDASVQNSFTNAGVWDYSKYTIGSSSTSVAFTVAGIAYNGMLSNLRIINGTGIYTGTFTPPTTALTTSQTSGTNIVAYTPTAPASASNSLQFNGTTNTYISISPSVGLSLYLNDYTIEFWHYLTGRPTGSTTPCLFNNYSVYLAGSLGMFAGHNLSDITKYQIAFNGYAFPANALVSNTRIIYGKWTHIAIVRRSGTVYLYINGILDSTSPYGNYNVTNVTSTNYEWFIGADRSALTTSYISGFISNFRVVNGIAVYSGSNTSIANFTVPTSSLTATQSSRTNIAAISNSIVTNGGAIYFPATVSSAYQTIPSVILSPGTYDWTVEGWVFLNAMPTTDAWAAGSVSFFGSDSVNPADGTHCVIGQTQMYVSVTNTKYGTVAHGMSIYNWYHIAYVKINNVVYFYVNGIQLGSVSGVPTNGTATTSYIGTAAGSPSYTMNGYISNLRVVKYVGAYTGTFPALSSPLGLTQSAVTTVNAITGTSTSLLSLQNSATTDASSNNFTLTINGTPTLSTTSPFAAAPINGSSVYFTGSSQYITAPSNVAFTFGTDNFTIEGWIYLASDTSTGTLYDARTGATSVSAQIYIASKIVNYAVAGVSVITGATLNTATWYHVAVVRISGVTKLYVNGIQSGNSYTDTNNYVIGSPYIGTGYGYSFPLTGYISNLRVVNGVGVYANLFTVPSTPLTSTRASITPVIALSNPSANGYSVNLNGTTQYLTVPQSAASGFQFGTGDFTIEFWIRTTDTAGAIISPLNGVSTGYWNLSISASTLIWQSSFGQTTLLTISTPSILDGIWHHVAVVRITGTTKIYIDGVQAGTVADATNYTFVNSGLQIGSDSVQGVAGSNSGFLSGLLSNIRIVKGMGVYTGNFILPATPLTSTQIAGTNISAITGTSTQLLAIQNSITNDASTNNTILTAVNSPLLSPIGPFTTTATAANGYSVYLSGSTQYVTLPISSVFTFAGDFTIEAWINMPVVSAGPYSIFGMYSAPNWFDFRYFQNNFQVSLNSGSGTNIGGTMAINTWTHVALVRIGSSINCYVNGVATGTTLTNSSSLGYPTTAGTIGRSGTANFFVGYMSNLRIVIGVGVYIGNFAPSLTPLTATQSAGTNIAAITGTSTALLALQNSATTDASTNNFTLTATGSPVVYAGSAQSPFNVNVVNSGVVLLTAQSGLTTDSAIGYPITNTNGLYQNAITPFGIQVPVRLLTAQSNIANIDNSTANITSAINATGANVRVSNVYGPFNNDVSLLTFQGSLITDYSNNRGQMTVVGGGVSPTDSSPFTPSKSLTSLLVPYGYVDTSYANAVIANTANTAQTNLTFNPYSIPSTLVSVLGLQTSNIVLESSINNSTFTTSGIAPTSNTSSPFGTYPTNGLITLNTSATTGIVGNIVNYANILVTAGDTITTNAYSITINTSLLANIGNRNSVDAGILPAQSNTTFTISDVANSNISEATTLLFANTSITPTMNIVDYGVSVSPSNITFIITDVANSNLSETLYDIFVSNAQSIIIPTDQGLINVSPSNVNFFITDVANSNISETIANVVISNVSSIRSITDTGTAPPSPVGGTVLFPTYAYTDGVTIIANNVQNGSSGGGSFASNQQVWYQT